MFSFSFPLRSAESLRYIDADSSHVPGDNAKVLNGTADAYIASFFVAAPAAATTDAGSGSEDEDEKKPKTGAGAKRKPAAAKKETKVKVVVEKGAKQTKLSFAKKAAKEEEDSD